MRTRSRLMGSGAVGIALAALVYFLAARADGSLHGVLVGRVPLPVTQAVVFVILLGVSLVEIPVMIFGLRTMCAGKARTAMVYSVNALYVAFASAYALLMVLLFGESNFSALLAGLSAVRWLSDWWIR